MVQYVGVIKLKGRNESVEGTTINCIMEKARSRVKALGEVPSNVLTDIYEVTESFRSMGLVYRAYLDGRVEYAKT